MKNGYKYWLCFLLLRLIRVIGGASSLPSSSPIVVAVDGGTESIRACCFDEGGNIVGRPCAIPYKTTHPFNAWAEQDPNDWYNCLGEAVRGTLDSISPNGRDRIRAICIDTTCCSVVAMDQDGTPIRPSLLWMDARSANETTIIMDLCRGDPALKVNCDGHGPLSAEWLLPKALWIRNHEPDIWERATMIGEYQDYINYKLTGGIFCASSCNAATRWHWDGNEALNEQDDDKNKYPGRPLSLYKSLGIPELATKLPQTCYAMGEVIGPLCREAAEHLSLPEGLPVVQGGPDAFVGMIGLGCIHPGQLCLITGSSHLHCVVSSDASTSRGTWGAYIGAPLPGMYFAEGGQSSSGSILRWAKQNIFNSNAIGKEDDNSTYISYETLDDEAAQILPGSGGLVALETFQGSRTPVTDPLARGALVGLTLSHTRAHLWRALLEAICFGTRSCIEALSDAGHNCREIIMAGGCARSPLLLQMHADVTGLPVLVRENTDAPLLGCAILAMVGSGVHKTVVDAVGAMVRQSRSIQPNPATNEAYTILYNRIYKNLSPSLRPIMHTIAELRGGETPVGTAHTVRSPFLVNRATSINESMNEKRQIISKSRRHHPIISPSLLACDWSDIRSAVRTCEKAGVSSIHVDVFDGVFLDSPYALTFGPQMVDAIRRSSTSNIKLDIHVCVERPERYVDAISEAGGYRFIFQFEAMIGDSIACKVAAAVDLAKVITGTGMKCGLSINPSTDISAILTALQSGLVDMVNILAVEPGFGGQKFQQHIVEKLQKLRHYVDSNRLNVLIMVDGGIDAESAKQVAEAGADVLAVGSYLFQHAESFESRFKELQLSFE